MYNREQKERFLNEFYYNEETKKTTALTFEKTAILEDQFETDLCRFNQEQLRDLLLFFGCSNKNALGKYFNQVQQYVKWSTENGYCTYNFAYANIFRKDLDKYLNVHAVQNQYFTRDEIYDLDLANAVDKAILVLFFEGVMGNELEEVRFLKKDDVKIIAREIHITNGKNKRVLDNIDERTIDILKDAIEIDEYYNLNGESEAKAPKRYMIDSDYVIRPTKMHNVDGEPISVAGINIKMRNIRKWLGIPYLTPKNIFYSGIFERLQQREKESELTNDDYKEVLEEVGMNAATFGMLKERYETYKSLTK